MTRFAYATIEVGRQHVIISCTDLTELQAVLQAVQSFDPQAKLKLLRPKPKGRIDEFINSHQRWLETVECAACAEFAIAQFCQRGWEPYARNIPDPGYASTWWLVSLRRRDE